MPNSNTPKEIALRKYSEMSTEELQQLLRDDASKTEGEEDITDLLCIMEVLARRRQAQNEGRNPEEALEDFRNHYLEAEEVFETEREAAIPNERHTVFSWLKGVAAAAAIFVLLFASFHTAKAFGVDLWAVVTQWTREVFSLRYETVLPATSIAYESLPDSTTVFETLEDALDAYSMDSSIVPTWIPEGYIQVEITAVTEMNRRMIMAWYESEDDSIVIYVADYAPDAPFDIQQSGNTCEIYERNGVDYYILQNNEKNVVAWLNGRYECFIGGPLSVDELKQMIDSIQKG